MNSAPLNVFIASASEGLAVANEVRKALDRRKVFAATVWNAGVFEKSLTFIESLEAALDRSDFAIITLTPDDAAVVRQQAVMAPRDNVIFELGLFMGRLGPAGRLGRERTYLVYEQDLGPKIPTDLLGVDPATFKVGARTRPQAIADVCAKLAARMIALGPRLDKRTSVEQAEIDAVRAFCTRVSGDWWQRVTTPDDIRLSWFSISPHHPTTTLRMSGYGMDGGGRVIAEWKSVAVCVQPQERTVFYSWGGKQGSEKGFEGFGHYTFFDSAGEYETGNGLFADLRGRGMPAVWKEVSLRRIAADRAETARKCVQAGGDNARKALVEEALAEFGSD